jgi:hypothetical protein
MSKRNKKRLGFGQAVKFLAEFKAGAEIKKKKEKASIAPYQPLIGSRRT